MGSGARILWLVRVAIALDALLYSGLIPLLPGLGQSGHLGDGELGLLLGIFPLAGLVACIPIGILADRWRAEPLVAIGMLASALGAVAIAAWPDPLVIGLARFAQGIAGSAVWTAGFALVHLHAPPDQAARAVGLSYSASGVGELSGPLLSGFLAERAGAAAFFWLAGLVAAAGGALLALLTPRHEERPRRTLSEPGIGGGRIALLAGGALAVVYNTIYGGMLVIAPLLLASRYHLTAFQIGQVFLGWHLVMIASYNLGGHWGDRVTRITPILAGTGVAAAGLLVASSAGSLLVTLGGLALAGAGEGVASTVSLPIFSDAWASIRPPDTGVGLAFGVVITVSTLGFTLGNMLGGVVMQATSAQAVLAGAAALDVATGLGVFWMGRYLTMRPAIASID